MDVSCNGNVQHFRNLYHRKPDSPWRSLSRNMLSVFLQGFGGTRCLHLQGKRRCSTVGTRTGTAWQQVLSKVFVSQTIERHMPCRNILIHCCESGILPVLRCYTHSCSLCLLWPNTLFHISRVSNIAYVLSWNGMEYTLYFYTALL